MSNKLQLWDPFHDVLSLKDEIDRVFWGFGRHGKKGEDASLSQWAPAVDISEDKEMIKISAELPGMEKKDVRISVENNILTIKGERTFKDEEKKKNYHRIERSYGMFERSFTLPASTYSDRIQANMKDGVLEVMIPKKEEAKPKEIEIQVR